jgi:glycosyltransferase involved in cell wall biosynthesis
VLGKKKRTNAPARVCIVGSSFHFMSGISAHTCMLANGFAERQPTSAILMRKLLPRRLYPGRDRVGADLSSLRYREDIAVFDGVDYYWVPSIFRAARFLRRQRPNVLVLQWWSGTVLHSYLALGVLARLAGAKLIIDFHETLDTAEAQYPAAAAYVRVLSRPFIALTSAAVVHSASDMEPVRERFPGLRSRPIAVASIGTYNNDVDAARWSRPRDPDAPFELLYFGTIRPYKGLENLIRAFDRLPAEANFTLTIVGETWENWTLPAELISASPNRDRITFVNTYVTDAQAAEYFHRADAAVLPYLRSSASGPLHLAMSHGLPVAVTAVGGLVEAVSEYTGARLVRPADVEDLTAALLELPKLCGPHADPHSWATTVDRIRELF